MEMPLLRSRVWPLAVTALLAAPTAFAADADGDGIPNPSDAFPCDSAAAAAVFVPAQGVHGMLLYEDQWPLLGDRDFNDLAMTYNYAFRLAADGRVLSIRATFNPLAIGGDFNNGFGLHMPIPTAMVASVTRAVGTATPEALTPSTTDSELTVTVSPNLREFFGHATGQINSVLSRPATQGQAVVVDVVLTMPMALNFGEAPYDPYIFRTANPAHQVHRPEYSGTASMDLTLFGSLDDGSTPSRHYVDNTGLPSVLVVPSSVDWPGEASPVSQLWPNILNFATSGGAQDADFYATSVNRTYAFTSSGGTFPTAGFMGPDHVPAQTGCIQSWGLAVDFGSSRNLFVHGSAVAPNGDTIVTGYVQGALPGYTNAGGLDLFVARYNGNTGSEMWTMQMGGAGDDIGRDVALDSAGNIYISGETHSNFGMQQNAGGSDALLVALDSAGSLRWSQMLGGTGLETGYGVAVDGSDDVIITGGSNSPSLPGSTGSGALNTFVASYDSGGNRQWTQQLQMDGTGTGNYDYAMDIAIDANSGALYVVGAERRYNRNGSAAENQFVAQLASDGQMQWVHHIGDFGYSYGASDQVYGFAHGVTVDHTGAVYVTGYWYGGTSNGVWGDWSRSLGDTSADATLTKVDATGQQQWSYALASNGAGDDRGESVTYSAETGLVFFAGRTSGSLPGHTNLGGDDFYLAVYDRSGAQQWLVQDGTAANDVGSAAATAAALLSVANGQQVSGSIFLVGNTTGALGGPDAGHWDISIRKYDLQSSVLQSSVIASTLGWTIGGWSGCSTQCGTGTETRNVTCHRADGVQVPNASCPQTTPAVSQSCTVTSGCNYAWEASAYSACSAACGSSSQTRSVICRQSDGSVVADSFCSSSGTRPSTSQSCTSHSTCTYSWYAGGWSACGGATCGTGSQGRTTYCARSDGAQVGNAFCSGSAPASSQSCSLGSCNSGCVLLGRDVRTLTRPPADHVLPACSAPGGAVCERSGVIPIGWRLATQAEGLFLSPKVGFGTCALWTSGCWYWSRSGNVLTCGHTVSGCHTGGCSVSGGFCYTAALLIREGLSGTCIQ